jgi:cell division protein FtsI/penicillin-binding protein 2
MLEMGTDILRQAIVENPLNYFRMLNAVARLTNGGLRCERHLLDEAAAKAEREVPAGTEKHGMTEEQMREFRELLNEM